MASKYVDLTAVVQIIGNVFNNPALLEEDDKYVISDEDFTEDFHKIVFGTIYNLFILGAKKITLENICDYLRNRPKSEAIFKQQHGEEWLTKVSSVAIPSSFDYYYSRLKKMSLLRAFDSCGIDVTDIYDPDNILDVKKRQQQEDSLDNSTLEELATIVDNKVSAIRSRYVDDCYAHAQQAGDHIYDLIDRLKENPEVGVPLYGPLVNTVTRGARLKKFYLRSAPTGQGKAIPINTVLPCPTGAILARDVKVGDYLFDAFGQPTKVLGVYPQGKKEVWEITLEDGRKAKCCPEHLWSFCTEETLNSNRNFITETLREMSQRTETIYLPMQGAVNYDNSKVPYGKWNRREINANLKEQIKLEQHIDPKWLLTDINTRSLVLSRLFTWSKDQTTFVTDGFLADSILHLAKSLGIKVTCEEKNYGYLITYSEDDFVAIADIQDLGYEDEMVCFYVDNPEHLFLTEDFIVTHNTRALIADACYIGCDQIYDETFGWIKNGKALPTLFISTEQELDEIQTMMLAFLSAVNEEHILTGKYQGDEYDRVLKAAEVLKNGKLYVEELPDFSLQDIENTIVRNIREHEVTYIILDYLHTSMKILEEITRRSGGVKLREDNILFMLSIRLKDLCNRYGIFIFSATQLSGDYLGSESPDQNLLRGAKSIADSGVLRTSLAHVMSQSEQKC